MKELLVKVCEDSKIEVSYTGLSNIEILGIIDSLKAKILSDMNKEIPTKNLAK